MNLILNAENFELNLEPHIFMEDIALPVNTSLGIRIASNGFCADANMDIGIKDMVQFATDLIRLYHSLMGTAVLEEPYGLHNWIKFSAQKGGHILVQGCLCKTYLGMPDQELQFANMFDQTYLRPFIRGLQSFISTLPMNDK